MVALVIESLQAGRLSRQGPRSQGVTAHLTIAQRPLLFGITGTLQVL